VFPTASHNEAESGGGGNRTREPFPTKRAEKKRRQAEERRAFARLQPYNAVDGWHGTLSGYSNHCCRCDLCRAAYKAYNDEWRKRPHVAERRREQARIRARRPQNKLRAKATQYGLEVNLLGSYLDDGICFACGAVGDRLAVDHDHRCCPSFRKVCGECVRGLLCDNCNKALGIVGDNIEHLRRLIAYLERWEGRRALK
jgi:hypothetical protein